MNSSRLGLARNYLRRVRSQKFGDTIQRITDPKVLRLHVGRLVRGRIGGDQSNLYSPSNSRDDERDFVADLTGKDADQVEALFREIETDPLIDRLAQNYERVRGLPAEHFSPFRFRMWYAIVRIKQPEAVIETGVHDGLSSTILLQALKKNGHGTLTSVDLPSTDLPISGEAQGWLVPDDLKIAWYLQIGDAKVVLPRILSSDRLVDIFIHDSDHSDEHQRFEFATVAPYMAPNGIMLSDQDYPHETVLPDMAKHIGARHRRVKSTVEEPGSYVGGIALEIPS